MIRSCWLALFAALIAFGGRAAAEPPVEVGRSVFVVSDVEGQFGDTPPKRLAIDDDIVFSEDITTGPEAKTAIEFRDGSTLEVGPGSVVRIDSFVFNPEEAISRKALQVGRGVFRYVSAYTAADQSTDISTPTGILAIRGSVVAGIVDPGTPTFVYVGEGNASFTNDAGSTDMRPGNAIAVPARTTPPMRPSAMPPAVAYFYSPDRGGEHPVQHLADFAGFLQADAYAGFEALYDQRRRAPGTAAITEVACWAHSRRNIFEVWETTKSPVAKAGLDQIALVYAVEDKARFAPPAERLARRADTIPLLDAFFAWAEATERKLSARSALAEALRYMIKRRAALSRFATDARLEADNNIAENAIRPIALGSRRFR